MSDKSKIEWTDASWQPVVGCTKVSEGCQNCYAERMAMRLAAIECHKLNNHLTPHLAEEHIKKYMRVVKKGWNGKVFCDESALDKPLHWHKPRRIFVDSMGDLFHPGVPFGFIKKVRQVAIDCPQHTLQFLTKRPEIALKFTQWMAGQDDISIAAWPRNCWLGVTAENQRCADERIPTLLQIPAAVRFVSCEPLFGEINFSEFEVEDWRCDNCGEFYSHFQDATCNHCGYAERHSEYHNPLDWVIVGCESGPKRRECKIEWVRSIVEQCKAADVPVFVKQIPINGKVSHKMSEWSEDLRLQEYPK